MRPMTAPAKTARKVLVVGSGGREHALALRLLASDSVGEVLGCPGNAGFAQVPRDLAHKVLRRVNGEPVEVALRESVDLVVVGPEGMLVDGLADRLRAAGVPCFGPSGEAARLEGSKAFMKAFCARHGIRAARDIVVSSVGELDAALAQFDTPPVVKADGLCAGKGVVVAESHEEARAAAVGMLSGQSFGVAGTTVVLEERLWGEEASIHALCDGQRAFLLPVAQDHKRIFDGDRGPNTGGMGTYAPAPLVPPELAARIGREVMDVVVRGMAAEGRPFIGALFAGIMVSPTGEPVVLEFNVRFGDPETQVLTLITDGDFGEALHRAALGDLPDGILEASADHAVCVVVAAAGYPDKPELGAAIEGLGDADQVSGVRVFHAGTTEGPNGLVTSGGRVLGVSARGATLQQAHARAYEAMHHIRIAGAQFRTDIGHRALR